MNEKPIGGQKDKQGCLTAAGYTWSQLKQTCIRPFEEGIALVQVNNTSSYTTATYILFDKNDQQVEIFTPGTVESLILKKDKNQNYSSGKYQLSKLNSNWVLYIDKNKEFEQKNKAI